MVTNPDRMEAVLEETFVLIADRKISSVALPAVSSAAPR
jgi:hypothetical protein